MSLLASRNITGGTELLTNPTLDNNCSGWVKREYGGAGNYVEFHEGYARIVGTSYMPDDNGIEQYVSTYNSPVVIKVTVRGNITSSGVFLYTYLPNGTFTALEPQYVALGETKTLTFVNSGIHNRTCIKAYNHPCDVDILEFSAKTLHGGTPTQQRLITSTDRGKALDLNAHQYIKLPNDSKLNITGDLTIKTRIKLNTYTGTTQVICSKGGADGNDTQWLLYVGLGVLSFGCSNGSSAVFLSSPTNILLGRWYDIVACVSGNTVKLSVDYATYNTAAFSGVRTVVSEGIVIGSYSKPSLISQYYFKGTIDRVKIWSRALTIEEAFADNTVPDTTNLVADYQFEGNADCSNDSSLNGQIVEYSSQIPVVNPVYVKSYSTYNTLTQQRLIENSPIRSCKFLHSHQTKVRTLIDHTKVNFYGNFKVELNFMQIDYFASGILCSIGGGQVDSPMILMTNASSIMLYVGNGTNLTVIISPVTLKNFTWYNIVAEIVGTTVNLTVNGVLTTATKPITTSVDVTSPFCIGEYYNGNQQTPNGFIQEVKISDPSGLKGYYKLNGNVLDSSGNNNHGTIVNSVGYSNFSNI